MQNKGDKVLISANNANSMAVGVNRYLKKYCRTTVSWDADVAIDLPAELPAVDGIETVNARVPQRFFFNYCTFGYSMTTWTWERWQQEIDWMALHGVNMPLQIKGMKLSISLREDTEKPNLVWVSLRSVDDFPCNEMAAAYFNGGGHEQASGGRLYFPENIKCSKEAPEYVKKALTAFFKV